MKTTDATNKGKTITRKSGELTETKKDLKGTQEELDAALAYYVRRTPRTLAHIRTHRLFSAARNALVQRRP